MNEYSFVTLRWQGRLMALEAQPRLTGPGEVSLMMTINMPWRPLPPDFASCPGDPRGPFRVDDRPARRTPAE